MHLDLLYPFKFPYCVILPVHCSLSHSAISFFCHHTGLIYTLQFRHTDSPPSVFPQIPPSNNRSCPYRVQEIVSYKTASHSSDTIIQEIISEEGAICIRAISLSPLLLRCVACGLVRLEKVWSVIGRIDSVATNIFSSLKEVAC